MLKWAYSTSLWLWAGDLNRVGMGKAVLVNILVYGKTQSTATEKILSICLAVWGVYQCDVWSVAMLENKIMPGLVS